MELANAVLMVASPVAIVGLLVVLGLVVVGIGVSVSIFNKPEQDNNEPRIQPD